VSRGVFITAGYEREKMSSLFSGTGEKKRLFSSINLLPSFILDLLRFHLVLFPHTPFPHPPSALAWCVSVRAYCRAVVHSPWVWLVLIVTSMAESIGKDMVRFPHYGVGESAGWLGGGLFFQHCGIGLRGLERRGWWGGRSFPVLFS